MDLISKINFNRIISLGLSKELTLDETMHLAFIDGMFKTIHLDIRMSIVSSLQAKGLIVHDKEDGRITMTSKGVNIFKSTKKDNSSLAKTLRELFPPGLKDDKWPWRSTNVQIRDKLDKFMALYPEAEDDQIVNATKNYLSKMRDNERGMSLLQYFILKNTDDGQKSILAEYIDVEEDLKRSPHNTQSSNITQI